jgi:hypothetical protein
VHENEETPNPKVFRRNPTTFVISKKKIKGKIYYFIHWKEFPKD